MRYCLGLSILIASAALAAAQNPSQRAGKTSLTGCIDERDGLYVLTNDSNLQPVARLKAAAGSDEDNFAQHMGQKVTVGGSISKEEPLPLVTVQSIKVVSETCGSSAEQPK